MPRRTGEAQPFGQCSKQHLAELVFAKDAKADCYKVERYDPDVCKGYPISSTYPVSKPAIILILGDFR